MARSSPRIATPASTRAANLASQASGTTTNTNTGWTAGGGVEWTPMSFPSWSLKAEYLYTDLGPVNQNGDRLLQRLDVCLLNGGLPGTTVLATTSQASLSWHTVRVGVNWHFNPFAAVAPVLAPSAPSVLAGLPNTKAPPPVVEPFHPFQVRLKLGGVVPTDGSAYITDRGTGDYLGGPIIAAVTGYNYPVTALNALGYSGGPGTQFFGSNTKISSAVIPTIDVAYYLTTNWAIEAICCVTPHHVTGVGPLQGASVIKTWVFPPSLMLQYHFTQFRRLPALSRRRRELHFLLGHPPGQSDGLLPGAESEYQQQRRLSATLSTPSRLGRPPLRPPSPRPGASWARPARTICSTTAGA